MAGRGRMPRQAFGGARHGYPDIPERQIREPVTRPPHPALLEEELELRMMEIRRLAADNRGMAEDRAAFHRELLAAKEELHRLNLVIADIRVEKEAHTRELIQKGIKLEVDLKNAEPLRNKVIQLRSEVKKLTAMRKDLHGKVQSITQDLKKAQAENQQIPSLKVEIEALQQELMHARNAFEYEKKGNVELMDQRQAMEKNLITMAREIEKLRADLANIEGRHWGVGGDYGMKLNSPEGHFPPAYGDGYGLHPSVPDKAPMYGAGPGSWGNSDKSRLPRR